MDSNSSAIVTDHITEHVQFFWNLNFDKSVIEGVCKLKLLEKNSSATEILLDCKSLKIDWVKVNGENTNFSMKKAVLSDQLVVPISTKERKTSEVHVEIGYCTSDKCDALMWLPKELTKGQKHPYLFSQCQAILARTLFPCQDTPSVKATYRAEVTAPKEIVVLMSAIKVGSVRDNQDGTCTHSFEQSIAIPSYLVAVAAGNLVKADIGPRTAVWTEPEMLSECASEFAETEKMLIAAEELVGHPYVWNRYELLVLPPSFAYGGMENPCLTFVTPTLVAGDRSLTYVVAHEIAHSWTGNLVTNCSWNDFWLNEGHTVYLERLILEKLHGTPLRHLEMSNGYEALRHTVDGYHCEKKEHFAKLVPNLNGIDPDDAFSKIPYEKGSLLLFMLEGIVGKDIMMRWLHNYIKKFELQSLSTTQWKTFFFEFMHQQKDLSAESLEKLNSVQFEDVFYSSTMPSYIPKFDNSLNLACQKVCESWISLQLPVSSEMRTNLMADFNRLEVCQRRCLLKTLLSRCGELRPQQLEALDDMFDLQNSSNSDIIASWCVLGLKVYYDGVIDSAFRFLNSTGRLKFVEPLYKALSAWSRTLERARSNFETQKQYLFPCVRRRIAELLASRKETQ